MTVSSHTREESGEEYLHCSEGNDRGNNNLHALLHLKIFDDKDRNDSKCPVRKRVQCRDCVCSIGDKVWRKANSGMVRVQVPPVGDGLALEENQTSVTNSDYTRDSHDDACGPDLEWGHCDTQEEESNGNLQKGCRDCVKDFTKEPISKSSLGVLVRESLPTLTSSVGSAAELAYQVRRVNNKSGDHELVVQSEAFYHESSRRIVRRRFEKVNFDVVPDIAPKANGDP
jgi:hypothetical protein